MRSKKNRKARGSVLLTVVAVMSLLIIFMFGTLSLATAANNRSHANYSDSQAEYTARAAIEAFMQAMTQNNAVAQTVVVLGADETQSSIEANIELDDPAMGKIGYYDENGTWHDNKVLISNEGTGYQYNSSKSKWELADVVRITVTARVGKEEKTVSTLLKKKAEYEKGSPPPAFEGFNTLSGNGYTPTTGYISGAASMGLTDVGEYKTYTASADNEFHVKSIFVNGNMTSDANGIHIYFDQKNSGMVVMGNYNAQNHSTLYVRYPYSIYQNGSWSSATITQKEIPYFYVDKTLNVDAEFRVNSHANDTSLKRRYGAPLNIFCGKFAQNTDKKFIAEASDIYMMDADNGESKFGANSSDSMLYEWSNSVVNGTDSQFKSTGGSIYCNHNLTLEKCIINGDLRVRGNLKINGTVTVMGDVIVGGTITGDSNLTVGGTIYCNNLTTSDGGLKAGYYVMPNTKITGNVVKGGYVQQENVEYGPVAVANRIVTNVPLHNGTVEEFENEVASGWEQDAIIYEGYVSTWGQWGSDGWHLASDGENQADWKKLDFTATDLGLSPAQNPDYGYKNTAVFWHKGEISLENKSNIRTNPMYYDSIINKEVEDAKSYYEILDGNYTKIEVGEYETYYDPAYYKVDFTGKVTNEIVTEPISVYQASKKVVAVESLTPSRQEIYDVLKAYYTGCDEIQLNELTDVLIKMHSDEKNSDKGYEVINAGGNNLLFISVYSDTLTDSLYTYYMPDRTGRATTAETGARSFFYKVDPATGEPTDEPASSIYSYYKINGSDYEEVNESEAVVSVSDQYIAWYNNQDSATEDAFYYNDDPAGHFGDKAWHDAHVVSKSTAYGSGKNVKALSAWGNATAIYPANMTREAITSSGNSKIVKTLDDTLGEINITRKVEGGTTEFVYDNSVYHTKLEENILKECKKNVIDVSSNQNKITGNDISINKSCIIKGNCATTDQGRLNITVNPGNDEIWIIIEDNTFLFGNIIVSDGADVNFYINGEVKTGGSCGLNILPKRYYDQIKAGSTVIIRETDPCNINFYGKEADDGSIGSKVNTDGVNCVWCGNAKCPKTELYWDNGTKKITYPDYSQNKKVEKDNITWLYVQEDGNTATPKNGQLSWIGNAVFGEYGLGKNNFNQFYLKQDADDSTTSRSTVMNGNIGACWQIMYSEAG